MAQQGRVQVRDLQSDIRLRPAPMQSDTYAAPAQLQGDQNLTRLSDALGSFSTSLGNLAPVLSKKNEGTEDDAYQAQRKYAGWTPEQWNTAVTGGSVPQGGLRTEQMAISAMAGDGMAAHQVETLRNEFMTATDWDATDVEARVRETMAGTLETHGADKNFGKPYARRMEAFIGTIGSMQQNRNIEQYEQTKKDSAFGHLSRIATDTKGKLDPKVRADRILAESKHLGKDGVLIMNNGDVDQEILNLAARSAEDDPEFALHLIDSVRVGSKGEQLPSIASKRATLDRTEAIRGVATKAIDNNAFLVGSTEQVNAGLTALEDGDYDTFDGDKFITLPSGETRKLEGSKLKESVLRQYGVKSEAISKQGRETGMERIAREERAFTMSGLKNPSVEVALTNLSGSLDQSILQDDEARAKVLGKLEVYQTIRKNSTNRLISYTTDADREAAEAFFIARNDLGHDDKEALEYAISVTSVLNKGALPSVVYHQDEISTAVNEVLNTTYGFDSDAANYSSIHQRVTILAQHNVARGMKPTDAVTLAGKTIQRSSMMYNGVVLGNVNGAVPEDFAGVADTAIDTFLSGPAKKQFDDGQIDKGNLALRPISGSDGTRFIIVDKETFDPISDDDGEFKVISLDTMRRYETGVRKKAAADKRSDVVKEIDKGNLKAAGRAQREGDIKSDKRPGFLEQEGIILPQLGR